MKIKISISAAAVTKGAIMAVFRRKAKSGVIQESDVVNLDKYIDKNPGALTKATAQGATPTKAAEKLFKIRFGTTMEMVKSRLQDKKRKADDKNKPVFAKEKNDKDVVQRWKEYAKEEKLSKKEIDAGLSHIDYQRRFNKHDGSIENKTPASIWRATNK